MWFKVLKPFGKLKVGELIELKEDSQHPILVEKGLIEESEAPKVETPEAVAGAYSTETIIETKPAEKPTKKEKK